MAEPRVFISSTFYDLRHVRADIDAFVRDMGYMPIRHEGGDVPYGREDALEEYCYREIERCDILLAVIGGRLGHTSQVDEEYSISQIEVKVALSLHKQVYVFIEKNVYHEFETYRAWPDADKQVFKSYHANDLRIHKFIEEVVNLPNNNPIFQFESASEIVTICRRQWAGLFQSMLLQHGQKPETDLVTRLNESIHVLDRVVGYFQQEGGQAAEQLLLLNHPFFGELQKKLNVSIATYCYTKNELRNLLGFLGWKQVAEIEWKDPRNEEWIASERGGRMVLRISVDLFDTDGRLRHFTPQEWQNDMIEIEHL